MLKKRRRILVVALVMLALMMSMLMYYAFESLAKEPAGTGLRFVCKGGGNL